MFKASIVRFFAVVIVIFSIGACVSADNVNLGQLQGRQSKRIVNDKDTIGYTIYYIYAKDFYNTADKKQEQHYTLDIGGCKLEFKAEWCPESRYNNRHHSVKDDNGNWVEFHSIYPYGVINPSSISFIWLDTSKGRNISHDYSCKPYFDTTSEPGKFALDFSLEGEVAPGLTVNIYKVSIPTTTLAPTTTTLAPTTTTLAPTTTTLAPTTSTTLAPTTTTLAPTTTTQEPTTLSTTQASSSTLPTSTSAIISATVKPPCPQCKERGLESWLIGLIVAIIILAILTIVLCAILFFCYRRMQKAKVQKVVQSEHTTVGSTMGTVSTAPGPLVKETNLYGPDMMYFGRDATPVDPNAKSQAVSPGPQATSPAPQAVSPAPATSPIQPAK